MAAILTFEEFGQGIGDAAAVLRNNAAVAGLGAPVPTCPGWTVRDLVTHQGVVHRWATAAVTRRPASDRRLVEAEAHQVADLLDWLDDGMVDLLNALASAPPDLDVPFFLAEHGPSREAWARRQAHETSIHAVDAMAARLGRPPHAHEVWMSPRFAADGIDELLLGFLPRPRTRLRFDSPARLAVVPTDSERSWTIQAGPDHAGAALGHSSAELTLSGTSRQLCLALWNRGEDIRVDGDAALLARYRQLMRVV